MTDSFPFHLVTAITKKMQRKQLQCWMHWLLLMEWCLMSELKLQPNMWGRCHADVFSVLAVYRHDVLQGETGVLCPQLSQELLHHIHPALSQTRGDAGLEGLHELSGDHVQSAYILQNGNFLKGWKRRLMNTWRAGDSLCNGRNVYSTRALSPTLRKHITCQ